MKDIDKDMHLALTGSKEELQSLVYHPSSRVISKILLNSNLSEALALLIANRKNIESEILESLFLDKRWKESYRIALALCKNQKTPQSISLSLLKTLRIFDLADLTRNQQISVNVRMRAESIINEKILSMPLGIKMTLAKRASSNILMRLLEDGMKEVVAICLDSYSMTEGIICKVLNMKNIASHVVHQIAKHKKWAFRYDVQWSLIRNNHAPLSQVVHFLKNMKMNDLKELYAAPEVPISTKPFIYREIMDREEL
jgi:hypothetical protein